MSWDVRGQGGGGAETGMYLEFTEDFKYFDYHHTPNRGANAMTPRSVRGTGCKRCLRVKRAVVVLSRPEP